MKKIDLPVDEIVEKYENGYTLSKLAQEYYVSQFTIFSRLNSYYSENRKEKPIHFKSSTIPFRDIIEKYENGYSCLQLAKKYHIPANTLSKKIDAHYSNFNAEKPKPKYMTERVKLPIGDIIKDYENGYTFQELAVKYKVSSSTICRRVNDFYKNLSAKKPKHFGNQRKIILPITEIIEKYENGVTLLMLSEEYNILSTTLSLKIREYYRENKKPKPKVLKSEYMILEYLNKGLTIEQIKEIAQNGNVIIPEAVIQMALQKQNDKNLDDNER